MLIFLSFVKAYGQDSAINLIPQPAEIRKSGRLFSYGSSAISYNNPECGDIAEMLAKKLNTPTGFSIKARLRNSGSIQLNLNKTADNKTGKEGYTLVSSGKGVVISANEPAGLFYGMQTLVQLLPEEVEESSPQDHGPYPE